MLLNWLHMADASLVCGGEGVGVSSHSQAPYTSRMGFMDHGCLTSVLAAGLRSWSAVGWGPWQAQTALQTVAFGMWLRLLRIPAFQVGGTHIVGRGQEACPHCG